MLVECKHHGHATGIQVSPDLGTLLTSGTSMPEYQEIVYNYHDEPYIRIIVSGSFAAAHGLGKGGPFDLPDEYPAWHEELSVVCERCLNQAISA